MMLLSLLLASAASASAYKPSQRMSVALWPMPVEVTNGSTTVAVDSPSWQFTMAAGTEATASLKAAAKRYTSLIFLHGRGSPPPPAAEEEDEEAEQALSGCTVSVANSTEVLGYGMDESYTLSVSVGAPDHSVGGRALPACSITAGTFVGAIWAMETLSQLILSEGGSLQHHTQGHPHAYVIMNAPWQIKDRPRFQYRGLMIDTSRHFLPMNAIRRQIDGLSFNKMNALHWHMTDAQSTPYDSTVHPKLKDGAFSEGAVYTPEDIKGLVEYARLRGVQIMLEVDMPGHSFAFGVGYPELLVNCSAMYPLETEFWCSSFDISRGEQLYTWLEALLTELTELLPSTMFHIGGDEVQYQCWESSPKMVAYLAKRNMTGLQLYQEFEYRMFDILKKLGKDAVTWDSTFQTGMKLPPNAVIHDYQGGNASVAQIAKAGVRVIVSSLAGEYVAGKPDDWEKIYSEDFMPPGLSRDEEQNVLGGATAMWGERTDDGSIDTEVWPDTCAAAERLWSASGFDFKPAAALLRLIPQRCRMYQRGIRAKSLDDRDGFGRRRFQQQCETILPHEVSASLPPLSVIVEHTNDTGHDGDAGN